MTNRTATLRLAAILGFAAVTLTGTLVSSANAEEHDRRNEHRYGGYRDYRGDHAPPPVIYQPYGYYQQPRAGINLNFPLLFR